MPRASLIPLVVTLGLPPILMTMVLFGWLPSEKGPLLVMAATYSILLAQTAHRYSGRFYFFIESWRLRLSGTGPTFSVRAEFEVPAAEGLAAIAAAAVAKSAATAKSLSTQPLSVVMLVDGLTAKVSVHTSLAADAEGVSLEGQVLVVEVFSGETPFRRAVNLATDTVPGILDAVRKVVHASSEKYSAELRFVAGNPYLGFFIQHVPERDLYSFVAEVHVPVAGDRAKVTAGRGRIVIVAPSLPTLSAAARRYLALRAP